MGRPARQRLRLSLAAGLGLLAACAPGPAMRDAFPVFGTQAELQWSPAVDAARRLEAARVVEGLWRSHEGDWHAWQDSALTRFNAALQRDGEAAAPAALRPLLAASFALREDSSGWFDPGIGRLVAAWGFHTSDWPVTTPAPDAAWRAAWAAAPDSITQLGCDPGWQCRTTNRRLQLDFNALAEGRALAEAATLLRARGIEGALLNLGGDVLALGDNGGRPWRVGLDDGEGGVLGGVELRDGEAFMSSGRYAKYREAPDGQRWPHVLDPRSGDPETAASLSAVLHPDPVRADAAATALLAAGPAHFEALVRGMGLGCALLIDADGRAWTTTGMAARFQWVRALPAARRVDHGAECAAAQSASRSEPTFPPCPACSPSTSPS